VAASGLVVGADLFSVSSFLSLFFLGCHSDVEKIVELAGKHNVVLIPFGGKE